MINTCLVSERSLREAGVFRTRSRTVAPLRPFYNLELHGHIHFRWHDKTTDWFMSVLRSLFDTIGFMSVLHPFFDIDKYIFKISWFIFILGNKGSNIYNKNIK